MVAQINGSDLIGLRCAALGRAVIDFFCSFFLRGMFLIVSFTIIFVLFSIYRIYCFI